MLDANAVRRRAKARHAVARAPLTGRLFDADGQPMSPAFSRGSKGRIYRYYVSSPLQRGGADRDDGVLRRVPTTKLDALVQQQLAVLLPRVTDRLALLHRVQLGSNELVLRLARTIQDAIDRSAVGPGAMTHDHKSGDVVVRMPITLATRGGRTTIRLDRPDDAHPDPRLISALRRAHAMLAGPSNQPIIRVAPASSYERNLLKLAFLAPRIQADIFAGRQPRSLTLERLIRGDIAHDWTKQQAALGWLR